MKKLKTKDINNQFVVNKKAPFQRPLFNI